jgi:hypothetical protein
MAELGVAEGDRVVLLDAGVQASDNNYRFFLTTSFLDDKGVEIGSKISKATQSFNYSVIYGAMLNFELGVTDIGAEAMIEKGLLYPKEGDTVTQFVAKRTAVGVLVPHADGEPQEIAEGVYRKLFAITNITFESHTRREFSAVVAEEEAAIVEDLFSDDNN